jgi:hypothetical protein
MVAPLLAQSTTAPAPATLTLEQKEEFLKKAKVVSTKGSKKGVTNTVRATLTDGTITHDASIQRIDEEKARFETAAGSEFNFRDSYKFYIAGYRLGRLLGLSTMIPPSVERRFQGANGSWTWWIEDVLGDDNDRLRKKITPPDKDKWSRQYLIMKVFDQLIYNTDRNQTNIIYDKDWRLWMIDPGRGFRIRTDLQDPKALERCDRVLLANMNKLTLEQLKAELMPYVREPEIKGLLARRDKIVAFFEKAGEARLYDFLPTE